MGFPAVIKKVQNTSFIDCDLRLNTAILACAETGLAHRWKEFFLQQSLSEPLCMQALPVFSSSWRVVLARSFYHPRLFTGLESGSMRV